MQLIDLFIHSFEKFELATAIFWNDARSKLDRCVIREYSRVLIISLINEIIIIIKQWLGNVFLQPIGR
ncbi:MAG: hypothetical protein CTY31_06000 [Hyphomicrobium sp.]|nr:MAG: hypothetical protein CTY39_10680 [Hyphomicrobium sp.]PPD00643.1 MAG: hypothetical protein CTY31_06000 [Hyphomicrobium sp.]